MIHIFDVDMGRRKFLRNAMAAAVGTALASGKSVPQHVSLARKMIEPNQAAKNIGRAQETLAGVKHARDISKNVGTALSSSVGEKLSNKSSLLDRLKKRAGKVENTLNQGLKVSDELDKMPVTRRDFLQKTAGYFGKGTRKYINYKLKPLKALSGVTSPMPGAGFATLAGQNKDRLMRFANVFASKNLSSDYLTKSSVVEELL
jgi:hypothetical protein